MGLLGGGTVSSDQSFAGPRACCDFLRYFQQLGCEITTYDRRPCPVPRAMPLIP
jgi:hypothetical protein